MSYARGLMQKAAAQYFGLNANSSYGLINGASIDGAQGAA